MLLETSAQGRRSVFSSVVTERRIIEPANTQQVSPTHTLTHHRWSVFSSVVTERHILSSKHTAGLSHTHTHTHRWSVFSSVVTEETHIEQQAHSRSCVLRADTLVLLVWKSCKCGMDLLYFVVVHCPYICVFGALCQEVQFCFHLIQVTVWTQSLLRGRAVRYGPKKTITIF